MSRRGLAFVLVLFCLPLFFGLRSLDLETDEAIYSFAIERILVDGEWLQPKSSPSDTFVFLEKPPLKFWIVAAPIKLGLLPNDEFGLRFWDALAGAIAFLYVFAIGCRLAGPVCGGVAVLLLFVHQPLVFEHGLRTNNMEGPLMLAYCGGVFHFLEWGGARQTRRRRHAAAAGLYFVLGFMTKFVAIVFLPAVLGLGALLVPATRLRLWTERSLWLRVALLGLLLILPWFVYAWFLFGSRLVNDMFLESILTRFGPGIIPTHVQPWPFYFVTLWNTLTAQHMQWFVVAGMLTLAVQAVRRWWFDGFVVLFWATLPILAISFGTSKLYHYTYPFLPAVMLAAGYLAALVMMLAPVLLRRLLEAVEDALVRVVPPLRAIAARPALQHVATLLIIAGAGIAIWTVLAGQARLEVGRTTLFRSTGLLRPIALVVVASLLARRSARVAPLVVALTLAASAPVAAYKSALQRLTVEEHPLRDVTNCVARVGREVSPAASPGLLVDSEMPIWRHPMNFYFRRLDPWTRQERASAATLADTLSGPAVKASLVEDVRYRSYLDGPERERFGRDGTPPMMGIYEYALVLPGPFRVCSPEGALPLH